MGETIELTDVVLRIIGAFYAFGGFVATRAGLMSQIIDQAIAAIALKKPTRTETAQNAWLIATAALVLSAACCCSPGCNSPPGCSSPPASGRRPTSITWRRASSIGTMSRTSAAGAPAPTPSSSIRRRRRSSCGPLTADGSSRSTRPRRPHSSLSAPDCCSMPATRARPVVVAAQGPWQRAAGCSVPCPTMSPDCRRTSRSASR